MRATAPHRAGIVVAALIVTMTWACTRTPGPPATEIKAQRAQGGDEAPPSATPSALSAAETQLLCTEAGYDRASVRKTLSARDAARLVEVLSDYASSICWRNTTYALGDVLEDAQLPVILSLLRAHDPDAAAAANATGALYRRPVSVMNAVDRLAARHPDSSILRGFLMSVSDPGVWSADHESYGLVAQSPDLSTRSSVQRRSIALSTYAIQSLGRLTATDEVRGRLESLVARPDLPQAVRNAATAVLSQALASVSRRHERDSPGSLR